jgi:dihydroorotase (multifunctional complex type)
VKNDILVRGGILVSSLACTPADILIREGKVAALGADLSDASVSRVLDVEGRYVLPGAVDGHVHLMDPGYTDREDAWTGSMAAARGGVTTIIDHHRSDPQTFDAGLFEEKREYLRDRMGVDFALMGGLSLSNLKNLRGMWDKGAVCFKGFTCFLHGAEALLSGDLKGIMEEVKTFGGIIQLHCEDDSVLKHNEARLREEGRKDPLSVTEYRSRDAEELAVFNVLRLAELTGCRVIVAHVSTPALIKAVADAQARGVRIYSESCGQYLFLDMEDLKKNGPFNKFTPPVRTREDVEGMWSMLALGRIDMINSDHCPFPRAQKEAGLTDVWKAPFGIPGLETTTRILLDGVIRKRIDIKQVAAVRSENPARIYGLSHRKGFLLPGYDADLIVVDLEGEEVLCNENVVSKCGWTPLTGRRIKGDVLTTIVRGQIVMEERRLCGKPGWGRFVSRAAAEGLSS